MNIDTSLLKQFRTAREAASWLFKVAEKDVTPYQLKVGKKFLLHMLYFTDTRS